MIDPDFALYLADPTLARDLGCAPAEGISAAPFEHEGVTFEPGDRVSDDFTFMLVYEGELEGWALCRLLNEKGDPAARRRFSELIIEEKQYAQKALGWVLP